MNRVVGVEHEFSVTTASGERLDMRSVVDSLELDGRRVDPGDPHAVRCRWGGVITADGKEAEVAVPPTTLEPGAATEVLRLMRRGEAELRRALEEQYPGMAMEGFSTHVSVEVADRRTVACAQQVLQRFAPALMLMTDRRTSPGLLIRPRRHRVELCGEHVDGDDLVAAVVFASAVVLSVDKAMRRPLRRTRLPRPVHLSAEPAVERFGWYVDRSAVGADLYLEGRGTSLRCGRSVLSAGEHLRRCWARVRATAISVAGPAELRLVDERVAGRVQLPCERPGSI